MSIPNYSNPKLLQSQTVGRSRKIPPMVIAVIVLFGISLFVLPWKEWLGQIEAFKIQKVKVETEWPLTEKRVSRWIPKWKGDSLLTYSGSTLAAKLKEKSWVKDVLVQKSFPDELVVKVTPKEPVAIFLRKQKTYFVDELGDKIGPTWDAPSRDADLPVISFDSNNSSIQWELKEAITLHKKMSDYLTPRFRISELVIESYPYFRTFLESPKVELAFHFENWESQISRLEPLLKDLPHQNRQAHRINLLFPKKAIVSAALSK